MNADRWTHHDCPDPNCFLRRTETFSMGTFSSGTWVQWFVRRTSGKGSRKQIVGLENSLVAAQDMAEREAGLK